MVGSCQHGTDTTDKDHEAVPGDLINEIADRLERNLGYKPNVVIINAGTNNANLDVDVDIAGQLVEDMLDELWEYPDLADSCVILSTVLPTSDSMGVTHRLSINRQYRELVARRRQDKCIWLADMEPEGEGEPFLDINGPYWSDSPKVHPNVSSIHPQVHRTNKGRTRGIGE